jgi:peptide/nickel transport system permease protein
MATTVDPSQVAGVPTRLGRRPNPRLAQMKRTWYFLRRNTLAMVGLSILVIIALVAIAATFLPISWVQMPNMCATDYGPDNGLSGWSNSSTGANGPFTLAYTCQNTPYVCTYEVVPPPNAAQFCSGHWYKTPYDAQSAASFPSVIAPTVNPWTLSGGPMPLGSLATVGDTSTSFYNIWPALLRGSDWSLILSVSIVGVGATLGMFAGVVAGFYGGVVDDVLMRLTDIFLSIPTILFIIVLIAVLSVTVHSIRIPAFALGGFQYHGYTIISQLWTPLFTAIIGFSAVWWPLYARLVRSQVLTVREQKYIEAARASGAGNRRILFRHIIPNSVYPVFIQFSLDVGTIPLLIGALVYLGFAPALLPTVYFPEWGTLAAWSVYDIQTFMLSCSFGLCVIPWWQLFFPGLAVFMFAVSVNLLSDGLRDALDPRLRR